MSISIKPQNEQINEVCHWLRNCLGVEKPAKALDADESQFFVGVEKR